MKKSFAARQDEKPIELKIYKNKAEGFFYGICSIKMQMSSPFYISFLSFLFLFYWSCWFILYNMDGYILFPFIGGWKVENFCNFSLSRDFVVSWN